MPGLDAVRLLLAHYADASPGHQGDAVSGDLAIKLGQDGVEFKSVAEPDSLNGAQVFRNHKVAGDCKNVL